MRLIFLGYLNTIAFNYVFQFFEINFLLLCDVDDAFVFIIIIIIIIITIIIKLIKN